MQIRRERHSDDEQQPSPSRCWRHSPAGRAVRPPSGAPAPIPPSISPPRSLTHSLTHSSPHAGPTTAHDSPHLNAADNRSASLFSRSSLAPFALLPSLFILFRHCLINATLFATATAASCLSSVPRRLTVPKRFLNCSFKSQNLANFETSPLLLLSRISRLELYACPREGWLGHSRLFGASKFAESG